MAHDADTDTRLEPAGVSLWPVLFGAFACVLLMLGAIWGLNAIYDWSRPEHLGQTLVQPVRLSIERGVMADTFKVGDRVGWNSEAGHVSGRVVRVHTRDFDVKGYRHHASADAPQYEIKSSKTEHIAFHKGSALTKLRD